MQQARLPGLARQDLPRPAALAAGRRGALGRVAYHRRSQATTTTRQAGPQPQQPQQPGGQSRHLTGGASKGLKRYQTRTGKSVFSSTRSVKFHVRYKCEFGQEVYLVGNIEALGNWDVMRGVQLVWSAGHVWEGSVELPAGLHIQYKYVVRNKDGSVVRWQEGANVSLELPGGNAEALALDVEDSWNKSKQVKRVLAAGTPVRFNIRLRLEFGQQLLVVGSCSALGSWNVDNAVRLNWQEGHIWESSIELPAGELVEYKYLVTLGDGSVDRWQPGDNLRIEVPQAQGVSGRRRGVLVLDSWSKSGAAKPKRGKSFGGQRHPSSPAPSWRSTPYSSLPGGLAAQHNADGSMDVTTASPRFGGGADIDDASSAMAARSYYSMMQGGGLEAAAEIRDPAPRPQHDPSVVQLWTDKPRFTGVQQHQAHQDPWAAAAAASLPCARTHARTHGLTGCGLCTPSLLLTTRVGLPV